MKKQAAFVVASLTRATQMLSYFADDMAQVGFEVAVFCPDEVFEPLKEFFKEKNLKRLLLPRVPQRSFLAIVNHLRYFTLLEKENEFQERLRLMDFETSGFLLPYVLWPLSRALRVVPTLRSSRFWDLLEKGVFGKNTYYQNVFSEQHFDWVVFPGPVLRAMSELQIFISAKQAECKIASVDEAWGQFAVLPVTFRSFDKIFVWNEYTIDQAQRFYDLPREMFAIEGPLRFDSYFKNITPAREAFFAKHGFDPSKGIISLVLSGVDIEFKIIDEIIERLQDDLGKTFQLVVRINPFLSKVSEYQKYAGVPGVSLMDPNEKVLYEGFTPPQSQMVDLGALLKYSSVIISHASTVAVEGAIFGTPAVYHLFGLDYVEQSVSQGRVLRQQEAARRVRYDKWASTAEVLNTGAVPLATSMNELMSMLDDALFNKDLLSSKRDVLVKKICTFTDGRTGERIAKHLLRNVP